jgi:hypothetical protein
MPQMQMQLVPQQLQLQQHQPMQQMQMHHQLITNPFTAVAQRVLRQQQQ